MIRHHHAETASRTAPSDNSSAPRPPVYSASENPDLYTADSKKQ